MGAFEILEIRASGAYAAVCLARRTDDGLQRNVALKVLRATLIDSPQILARTRDEARVLSKLNHPNIVSVEELLAIHRRPVIVMEWVPGVSVRELLGIQRDGLPVGVALEIVRRTARALHDAHETRIGDDDPLHIVHRDIKPANILVSERGRIKVVDFGLARGDYYDRETTTVSTILGSLGYMAPERFFPGPDGPAVDVYSLGLTLAEMVSGHVAILPREEGIHDRALDAYLARLGVAGLEPDHSAELARLLGDMCRWSPAQRIVHAEAAQRIRDLQRAARLSDDLTAYAEKVVAPLYQGRSQVPPREHPAWSDVGFVETDDDGGHDAAAHTSRRSAAEADRRVRAFLDQEGWEKRARELKWLLALHPEWRPEPFIDILTRASKPWWQFWARPATDEQVVVALGVLKHRLVPDLVPMCRALCENPNAEVAEAARTLIHHYARTPSP